MTKKYLNIPEKIIAGYSGYPGDKIDELIYLTYLTKEGKIAKEKSWNGWRLKSIEPKEFDNLPINGISIVGSAGNCKSGWNFRQAYCQIRDPRGFEVQITLDNLLWILQMSSYVIENNVGTFKSKFVYAWDGQQLVLCPVESDDFKYTKKIESSKRYQPKECIPGHWYKTPNGVISYLFLGGLKSLRYSKKWNDDKDCYEFVPTVEKKYIFAGKYGFEEKPATIKSNLFVEVKKDPVSDNELNDNIKKYYRDYCVDNELHGKISNIKSIVIPKSNESLLKKFDKFIKLENPMTDNCSTCEFMDTMKIDRFKNYLCYYDHNTGSLTFGWLYVETSINGVTWDKYYSRNRRYFSFRNNGETEKEEEIRLRNEFMKACGIRIYFNNYQTIWVEDNKLYFKHYRGEGKNVDYNDLIKHGEFLVVSSNNENRDQVIRCEDTQGEIDLILCDRNFYI